jgi:hypothetical protein
MNPSEENGWIRKEFLPSAGRERINRNPRNHPNSSFKENIMTKKKTGTMYMDTTTGKMSTINMGMKNSTTLSMGKTSKKPSMKGSQVKSVHKKGK